MEQQKRLQLQKDIGEVDKNTDSRIVIVLDMGYNRKVLTSQIITFIFMNGQHYDITLIVAIQHVMQLTPALRSNTDYVICLKEGNKNVLRNLYENFFGVFEKPVHFKNAFDACTKDFGCLILNNTVTSVLVNETVNWFLAAVPRLANIKESISAARMKSAPCLPIFIACMRGSSAHASTKCSGH